MAKHYSDYAVRLKDLWESRPNRPYAPYQRYLIGKNISETSLAKSTKERNHEPALTIEQFDVKTNLAPYGKESTISRMSRVNKMEQAELFKVKKSPVSRLYGSHCIDQDHIHSDSDSD